MEKHKKYRFRFRSFYFAFRGIFFLFQSEINALIHLAALVSVIIAGFYFDISANEWLAIVIVSAMVFATELLNTAVEKSMDFISKNHHPEIGKIKDLAAASVLICAVAAIITGLVIFVPKF